MLVTAGSGSRLQRKCSQKLKTTGYAMIGSGNKLETGKVSSTGVMVE